ncbi:MAG: hypothetical protein LW722_12985, partial [Rubrivivax sp.]|nr:hypothetical protein [Rubrivivax sp.]
GPAAATGAKGVAGASAGAGAQGGAGADDGEATALAAGAQPLLDAAARRALEALYPGAAAAATGSR